MQINSRAFALQGRERGKKPIGWNNIRVWVFIKMQTNREYVLMLTRKMLCVCGCLVGLYYVTCVRDDFYGKK